jgi:hypothetical protein
MEVFVNEQRVKVAARAVVRDGVAACDPALLEAVVAGIGYVTDGVGRRVGLDDPLAEGSILRVVLSARSPGAGLSKAGGN